MHMTDKQIEAWWAVTAYHEAGHALASLVCQFPFEYVTLKPYEDAITSGLPEASVMELGHLRFTEDPLALHGIDIDSPRELTQREIGLVHRVMVTLLAGYYTAKLIVENGPEKTLSAAYDDLSAARTLATFLAAQQGAHTERYYIGEAIAQAQTLITESETLVDTLACALLRKGELTYADALNAVPPDALTQARMAFLMEQRDEYLTVEEAEAVDKWEEEM